MADVSTVALQRPVACSVSDEMASGMVGVGMGLEVGQSIAWIMVAFSWLAGSWDTNDTAAARSWSPWCANQTTGLDLSHRNKPSVPENPSAVSKERLQNNLFTKGE